MLKNYFIVAFRHIIKNKLFSLINIGGLAIGITSFVLILLYVHSELQFDKYNKNADDLYRIINYSLETGEYSSIQPVVLMQHLLNEIPEIDKGGILLQYDCNLSTKNKVFHEENFVFCDSTIFDMFSWGIVTGDKNKPFKNANSILLTDEMAKKYFGNENPIGKIIRCDDTYNYIVDGIIKIPKNTHLKLDFLVSMNSVSKLYGNSVNNWYNSSCNIYLLLKNNSNPKIVEQKINKCAIKNGGENFSEEEFKLQALKEIHLYSSQIQYDRAIKGNIIYVRSFIFIAILIILIACLNYINLSTAKATSRAKEIGIRKVLGSYKGKLIKQMLGETFLITSISGMLSLLLLEISIPFFNEFSGQNINLITDGKLILAVIITLVALISFFSGIYPAFILSGLQPIAAIKGTKQLVQSVGKSGLVSIGFRKVLFVVQLCITMGLIIASLVIYKQLEFTQNKNMGFKKEQLLVINNPMDDHFFQRYQNYKNAIKQNPDILEVTASHNVPSKNINNYVGTRLAHQDENASLSMALVSVDFNFFKTIGATIITGRDFSEKYLTDSINACIVNEASAKALNLKSPVGVKLKGFYGERTKNIIGVVKDINYRSFHYKVQPMVFIVSENKYPFFVLNFIVKINTSNTSTTIKFLEKELKKVAPQWSFNYYFVDENFNNLYQLEEHAKTVVVIFTILGILISAFGLFGLILFITESKTKEISIRKVFGANVKRIIYNILIDFFKLIVFAAIIIMPIVYLALDKWLASFAYRINLGFGVFALALLLSLFIVFTTIIYQTYKAANANPAKALKYE